jgi:hypothetical protein
MAQYITIVMTEEDINISYRFKCSKYGKDGVIEIPIKEIITESTNIRNIN